MQVCPYKVLLIQPIILCLTHIHACACIPYEIFPFAVKWGKQLRKKQPFDHLTSDELKEELWARRIYDFQQTKKDMKEKVTEVL